MDIKNSFKLSPLERVESGFVRAGKKLSDDCKLILARLRSIVILLRGY